MMGSFPIVLASLAQAAGAPSNEPCTRLALVNDPAICEQAIAQTSDPKAKATLYFQRAYLSNEDQKYEAALKDLDESIKLDPDNANALHERGFTQNALGNYAEAILDLNRETDLIPRAQAFQERSFARRGLGDFVGAYADTDRVVSLSPNDASALLARSDDALWLGRFDQATADAQAAEKLAQAADASDALAEVEKHKAKIALWQTVSSSGDAAVICTQAEKDGEFTRPNLIGDCTAAFLRAATPADKAGFLTTRSLVWLAGRQDLNSSVTDRQMAAALDPSNAKWHTNLGYAYIQVQHSWAARREFDRSLAISESWLALAGRATAKYNLGDKDGALIDAKRSFALEPNGPAIELVGDIAFDAKDTKAAKEFWMAAYQQGDHGDDLVARLKSVGVDDPGKESRR